MTQTENQKYNVANKGATNWHILLNENFRSLDASVPIKDVASNLSSYEPKENATFIATDTGEVYDGNGNQWQKATRSYGGLGSDSAAFENIVFTNQGANDWVVQTPDDNSRYGSPTDALKAAASNGGDIHLVDSIPTDNPITETIDIGSASFYGPGSRGEGYVYIDTDQADPGIKKTGNGYVSNVWFRGDPDAATNTWTSGDLLWLQDMGRGSYAQNLAFFGTRGNGMVVAGCQQMSFNSITSSTCGDPSSDNWHIYLTNSPVDGLETNANNWFDIQRHGNAGVDGGWIAMRADQHTDNDYPRTQHFYGINVENGPTDSSTPVAEVTGRDHIFAGGRIGNIDQATAFFQVNSSAGRARDCLIYGLKCIAGTDDPATTDFWDANGIAVATPMIVGCPKIDMTGSGVILDNYNQTNQGLQISGCDFDGTSTIVDVSASKDAGEPVSLNGVYGSGSISVQGARLSVNNVPNATWSSQSAEFGPRLIADDGSFGPRFLSADTSGGNGVASATFSGDFELKGGIAHATAPRGNGTVVQGTELTDSNGDGDLDTVTANVLNVSDGTAAADGITVAFEIVPITP